jgi:two-component system nitrate/nitrite response regulator NarL
VKVVVITASQTTGEILQALYAGASGFACQDISGDQLIKSLELIMLGQTVVYPQFCKLASSQQGVAGNDEMAACDVPNAAMGLEEPSKTGFSKKELSILRALMDGASNKVIAQKLVITESTVKVHMKAILRKLRLHNRTQAALWARQYLQLDGI